MTRWCALVLPAALLGCSPDASGGEASTESPPGTEHGTEPSAGAETLAGRAAGELPEVGDVIWQIFDETREPEGPRRTTLHVLVPRDGSRDELRKALTEALELAAQEDTMLVAARAIGYRPEQTGPADAKMVAFVWAEWLPSDGWYRSTESSRGMLHRMYFYHNLAPEW